MKRNVLDVKVSLFNNVQNNKPMGEISLYDFLCSEKHKQEYQSLVEKYRTADENKDELKKLIPAVTVSGTFEVRNTSKLKEYSGLICIDIDAKDNEHLQDFNDLHKTIANVPHVAYCGRSVSGNGYFAIIPISDPQQHKEHFTALKNSFYRCHIVIDSNCSDVSRLRIYSHDPNAYINHNAKIYDKKISVFQQPTKAITKKGNADQTTKTIVTRIIKEIVRRRIDITNEYKHWVEIASVFYNEFGEEGRKLFHAVSRISTSKYNEVETNKQFDNVIDKPYPYRIGTFYKYVKEAGLNIE